MENPNGGVGGSGLPEAMHPIYTLAESKVNEIEAELKRLGRWSEKQPPAEAFENMGASGGNSQRF